MVLRNLMSSSSRVNTYCCSLKQTEMLKTVTRLSKASVSTKTDLEDFSEYWKDDGPNENCNAISSQATHTCANKVCETECSCKNLTCILWNYSNTWFNLTHRQTFVRTSWLDLHSRAVKVGLISIPSLKLARKTYATVTATALHASVQPCQSTLDSVLMRVGNHSSGRPNNCVVSTGIRAVDFQELMFRSELNKKGCL